MEHKKYSGKELLLILLGLLLLAILLAFLRVFYLSLEESVQNLIIYGGGAVGIAILWHKVIRPHILLIALTELGACVIWLILLGATGKGSIFAGSAGFGVISIVLLMVVGSIAYRRSSS